MIASWCRTLINPLSGAHLLTQKLAPNLYVCVWVVVRTSHQPFYIFWHSVLLVYSKMLGFTSINVKQCRWYGSVLVERRQDQKRCFVPGCGAYPRKGHTSIPPGRAQTSEWFWSLLVQGLDISGEYEQKQSNKKKNPFLIPKFFRQRWPEANYLLPSLHWWLVCKQFHKASTYNAGISPCML